MKAKPRNPLRTKNDKVRIKGFTLSQLEDLKSKSSRPKDKDKIQRRINNVVAKS